MAERLTNLLAGGKVAVEALHEGCGRPVVNRPETGHHALGSRREERSRKVHDPFLAGKAPSAGFTRRQHDNVRV